MGGCGNGTSRICSIDQRFHEKVAALVDPTSTDVRFGRKLWMLQAEMTVPQQITGGYAPTNRFSIPGTPEAPFALAAYSHGGGLAGRRIATNLDGSGSYQPGSAWASTAVAGSYQAPGSAKEVPSGQWITVHLRVKPGHRWQASNPTAAGVRDTIIRAEIALEGESAYTTVIDLADQALVFGSSGPSEDTWTTALPGFNAIALTGYLKHAGGYPSAAQTVPDFAALVADKGFHCSASSALPSSRPFHPSRMTTPSSKAGSPLLRIRKVAGSS